MEINLLIFIILYLADFQYLYLIIIQKLCKMAETKKSTSKTVYWILLILSVITGFVFYTTLRGEYSLQFLVLFSGVPFLLFVSGVFGLMWPIIKPEGEELYIKHTLLIGLFFIIMFFLHVWIVLPLICPSFAACLDM